jgi:hypothetical protein
MILKQFILGFRKGGRSTSGCVCHLIIPHQRLLSCEANQSLHCSHWPGKGDEIIESGSNLMLIVCVLKYTQTSEFSLIC